jgi:hypothetical protein
MMVFIALAVSFSLEGDSTRVFPRYLTEKKVSGGISVSSGPVLLLLAVLQLAVLQLALEVLGPTDSQLLAKAHSSQSSEISQARIIGRPQLHGASLTRSLKPMIIH